MKTTSHRCQELVGHGAAAALLYRIAYWHPRMQVTKWEEKWIAKARDSWREECGLTPKQYRGALAKLKQVGLIETRQGWFAGKCIGHVRLSQNGIEKLFAAPPAAQECAEKGPSGSAQKGPPQIQEPTYKKENSPSENYGMATPSVKEDPGMKVTDIQSKILSSPKLEKKHMNAGAWEVKPLHLQIAFRQLCAEHWPSHWTGTPEPKEMKQWKHWIAHCGGNHPGHVLDCALNNWIDFAKVVSATAGTNLVAPKPSPGFLLQNCTTAVNFFLSRKADAKPKFVSQPKMPSHFVPAFQSTAKSDKDKPASYEEVMAILGDDE